MKRDEAIELLTRGSDGVKEWNERRSAGEKLPDVSGANLSRADLNGADLNCADLSGADLRSESPRANGD